MTKSKQLDQFYTNPLIAKRFVDKINDIMPLVKFDNVIEPSAGSGIILTKLPKSNRIGLDLDPKHKEVIAGDFFDYKLPNGSNAIVGNPPFGRQSKLAIEFFNKCALNSDLIAFIIPRSWMKYRVQNQLNKDFGLYYASILPDEAFIHNDKPYRVRCCAQIWIRNSIGKNLPEVAISEQYETWNTDVVSNERLLKMHNYQIKTNCYEEPETLF